MRSAPPATGGLGRRLLYLPLTLLGITLLTFFLAHALPGDAVDLAAGMGSSPAWRQAQRHALGLDRPLPAQYVDWLARSLRGDFGASRVDGQPVRAKVAAALPTTLALALLATVLAFGVALPLGTLLALHRADRLARTTSALLYLLYALPGAAVALWVLRAGAPFGDSSLLGLLPAAGCLALGELAKLTRQMRNAVLSTLEADYVTTARAKGAGAARVALHALRNALLPMVTLFGAELPALLSATVLVETVFGLHGLGLLAYDAVLGRDDPLILALTTLGALAVLLGALAADAAYALFDPRLRGSAP